MRPIKLRSGDMSSSVHIGAVPDRGLIHAFAVYSVEVISLWTWLQDSRWSALLPCRLTGKLTYRTPWTVSPGTPTRNPTPRRNYRCPSRDTAVTGRRRSLLPEPVRPQPRNIIHYFLYQCVIWISHYFLVFSSSHGVISILSHKRENHLRSSLQRQRRKCNQPGPWRRL